MKPVSENSGLHSSNHRMYRQNVSEAESIGLGSQLGWVPVEEGRFFRINSWLSLWQLEFANVTVCYRQKEHKIK